MAFLETPRAKSDTRLARRAATGDGDAFRTIYERYGDQLYNFCHSIVGNADDALDALQSTMLNAYRGLPAQRRGEALRPWLYTIAHNEAISIARRRHQHEDIATVDAAGNEDMEEVAASRARVSDLFIDLGELPERQRSALLMRELSGLDYSEIGTAFGVSSAAAKQIIYEARRSLDEHSLGREMSCEHVQRSLSDHDRRRLRARRVRAHLRNCIGCRDTTAPRLPVDPPVAPPAPPAQLLDRVPESKLPVQVPEAGVLDGRVKLP
jgi:RNA polymerase sigma factor (sigma-70 family)